MEIKVKGFAMHSKWCKGVGPLPTFVKLNNCPHCGIDMPTNNRANHVRWCDHNPKRSEYVQTMDCSQMHTPIARKKQSIAISKAHADGKYNDRPINNRGWNHSPESIDLIRNKALASGHRRLVRSIRNYTRIDGSVIKLDSSWEEALAVRLDQLSINWTRPLPVPWTDDDGNSHRYFPDFYLPEFDLYLDPKNPFAIIAQKDKLRCLQQQLPNLIVITTLADCKAFSPN